MNYDGEILPKNSLKVSVPGSMARLLGPRVGRDMPRGHYCMVYESDADHLAAAASFLEGGLVAGDACIYFLEDDDVQDLRSRLVEAGVDVAGAEARGDLMLRSTDEPLSGGRFVASFALEGLQRAIEDALARGYPGVRLGGDMGWAQRSGVEAVSLEEYEGGMDSAFRDHPSVTIMCGYDLRHMGSVDSWRILASHPILVFRGSLHANNLYRRPAAGGAGPDPREWLDNLAKGSERLVRMEFLARVLEGSDQPVAVSRPDGIPVLVNSAFETLRESLPETSAGQLEDVFLELASILEDRDSAVIERDLARAEGGDLILGFRGHAVRDARGEIAYVCAFVDDVTRERAAVRALRRERDFISRLMETNPAGITVVDRDGTISFANSPAEEILGLERSRIKRRTYNAPGWKSTDFSGEPIRDEDRIFARVMSTGEPVYDFEECIERPDGTRVYLRINGAPLHDDSGEIEGVVFALHDVTALRRAEEHRARKLELLSRLAGCETLSEATRITLDDVMDVSGMEAGAIRLARDGDFTFYEHRGFSPAFVRAESHLTTLDEDGGPVLDDRGRPLLECVCGQVLRGEIPIGDPAFTLAGSFWTGDTEAWMERIALDPRIPEDRYRGHCYEQGYRTVALIPVGSGQDIMGLIQLNDRRKNAVAGDVVEYIEDISGPAGYVFRHLQAKESLRASEDKYRSLIERASDTIVIIQDYVLKFANPRVQNLLGYSPEEIVGTEFLRHIHYEEIPEVAQRYNRRMGGDESIPIYQTRLRHRDGREVHVELNAGLIDFEGRPADMVIIRDITDRIRSEERLRYLGMHDQLTGLYNRAYFEAELARLDVERQLPLSLVMGDLNGLKLVNDAFGHQEGDRLLREVAEMFRRHFREEDVVARWGGDEFIVILPQTGRETAEAICGRLKEAFADSEVAPVELTVSLGTATKDSPQQDVDSILRLAEERMYRNKTGEARHVRSAILESLQESLRVRSFETEAHSRRLRRLSLAVGDAIGVPEDTKEELALLSDLHDIGEIALPEELLTREGPLGEQEWGVVRGHTVIGYRIAQSSPDLWPIADAILSHHEWWDGSGYPEGLSGEDIPLTARIMAIADAYDVMVTGRPYRSPLSHREAMDELHRAAGTQFDPQLVDVFAGIIDDGELVDMIYRD